MARARLTIAGETGVAILLLFLMIVLYLWADSARREALAAQRRAEEQSGCEAELHAKSDEALLSFLVALSSGEGAETARVDAQLATGRWVEARQRCGG